MSAIPAPASLFRASALSTYDAATGTNAPWLEEGFHLRVKVNPWIGFPIHPFAAWRMEYFGEQREPPTIWAGASGQALTIPFDLGDAEGVATGTLTDATADDPWIWIELDIDDGGVRLDLLDGRSSMGGAGRVVATRRHGPFRFGHTAITRLRLSGQGAVQAARGIRLSDLVIEEFVDRPPDLIFGLPQPFGPWYAPDPATDPRDEAAKRVFAAAPRRLSPPDNPTGALPDDTDPGAEADRIVSAIAPRLLDPWLDDGFRDPEVAPVHAVRKELATTDNGSKLTMSAPVTPSLLTMAVDPQIARYLGLATKVGYDETASVEPANVWVVASRWAVQRNRTVLRFDDLHGSSRTLGAFLESANAPPNSIEYRLEEAFPDSECLTVDIPNRPFQDDDGPWSIATLFAVAVAAGEAPPDAPDPFNLAAAEPGAWNAHDDPSSPGPETWRQLLSLGDEPARGMVGFARMSPGAPVALHRLEPPPEEGFVTRALPLLPNWASNNRRLVTDRAVPPDPAGASWQVWHADEFGQWTSPDIQPPPLELPLPARPGPPPPQAEVTYVATPDDGSTGQRVPGQLRLRYVVPDSAHAAPGSRSITELRVSVDGVALAPIAVEPGETVLSEAGPAPFAVGEQRHVVVVSTYRDEDGTDSVAETIRCDAFDARAPRVIPTSPMLLWTGQPDVTGQAELALRWPPREGATRYRVYLGDSRRLAGTLGIALPESPIRAEQANPIYLASTSLVDKQAFTFLGEVAGTPSGDGLVRFDTRIPGSLRGVQFVRIVPLTAGGAEADFRSCGLVPVAVPTIDRPPTPALDAVTDPTAGLTLTIRALGLRTDLLAAAPGGSPQYRLRRTRRSVADRMYVPIRASGTMSVDGEGLWTATVGVPAAELEPFVRTTWLAEVRYPAEPPIPPGDVALPVDGGVEPVWSPIGSATEGLWSDPSPAAESLLIPTQGPEAPAVPALTLAVDGSATLSLTGLPTAHPAAIAPYRLEVYRGTPGVPLTLVGEVNLLEDEVTWSDAAPPADARYDVVVVDPIGRRSPAVQAMIAPP